ncbi:MAG: glycerol kinase GlpK [Clostridium sp.]|nr:glycerol kinase GlpK [Clostridium sp.]
MKQYMMALDQGTTSSRCVLFDKQGKICSLSQKELEQLYPQPGWVEQDPMEIWSSLLAVAIESMARLGISPDCIRGIGITNQRETTICWNARTGEPIYRAIVWQCRRTADRIEKVKADGFDRVIRERTGLIPDAYFSATKIAWILENVPGAREKALRGELLFGTVDTWLIWNLTRGAVHATDPTNASRTLLYDIHRLCWDEEILSYFQIPASMLPKVQLSGSLFGYTAASLLGASIPIAGVSGDQQAALFGQCCFEPGEVKNTYGTGCFLLMNTGKKAVTSNAGLLTTIAAAADTATAKAVQPQAGTDSAATEAVQPQAGIDSAAGGRAAVEYALEGSVFVAGAAIQWLRDGLRLLKSAPQSETYAERVKDTAGLYVVPAFTGMGTPYWNPYARGTIVGVTRGCAKEHLIRATLEAVAYQTADVLRAMEEDSGIRLKSLRVDGGASANDFLMQFQADIMDTEVLRPDCIETTALGAAYLAGLTVGYWKDKKEIRANWQIGASFQPQMEEARRTKLLKGWRRAVSCALAWAEE